MDVSSLGGKAVLVTGAASGIGKATAIACARRGGRLFIGDVDERGLDATAEQIKALGATVTARRLDVADRHAMSAFAEEVHGAVEAVDLLINNAGVAIAGGLLSTSLDDWDWITSINLTGVFYGCHFFIPAMVARRRGGHVVNVASSAGYVATAPLAAYSTTKFAVVGLSEALRQELREHGIGVTAICPGIINTAITRNVRRRGTDVTPEALQRMAEIFERRNFGPERVADGILRAVQRNRALAPITAEAWVMYYLKRLSPGLIAWISSRVQERVRAGR